MVLVFLISDIHLLIIFFNQFSYNFERSDPYNIVVYRS